MQQCQRQDSNLIIPKRSNGCLGSTDDSEGVEVFNLVLYLYSIIYSSIKKFAPSYTKFCPLVEKICPFVYKNLPLPYKKNNNCFDFIKFLYYICNQ